MGRPAGAYGHKRKGRFSTAEHAALQHAAVSELSPEKAAEKLAPVMGRSVASVKDGIIRAREKYALGAETVVDALLNTAVPKAASKGNVKGLLEVLERIQHDGDRVIEPLTKAEGGSGITITIAPIVMGGTKQKALQEPEAQVIDVQALPAADAQ